VSKSPGGRAFLLDPTIGLGVEITPELTPAPLFGPETIARSLIGTVSGGAGPLFITQTWEPNQGPAVFRVESYKSRTWGDAGLVPPVSGTAGFPAINASTSGTGPSAVLHAGDVFLLGTGQRVFRWRPDGTAAELLLAGERARLFVHDGELYVASLGIPSLSIEQDQPVTLARWTGNEWVAARTGSPVGGSSGIAALNGNLFVLGNAEHTSSADIRYAFPGARRDPQGLWHPLVREPVATGFLSAPLVVHEGQVILGGHLEGMFDGVGLIRLLEDGSPWYVDRDPGEPVLRTVGPLAVNADASAVFFSSRGITPKSSSTSGEVFLTVRDAAGQRTLPAPPVGGSNQQVPSGGVVGWMGGDPIVVAQQRLMRFRNGVWNDASPVLNQTITAFTSAGDHTFALVNNGTGGNPLFVFTGKGSWQAVLLDDNATSRRVVVVRGHAYLISELGNISERVRAANIRRWNS
jgi:hypothetical protein